MRLALFCFLILSSLFSAQAEFINIGIFSDQKIKSAEFHVRAGKYALFTEAGKVQEIDSKSIVSIKLINNLIQIKADQKDLGLFKKINFVGIGWYNHFKLDYLKDNQKLSRRYDDNLKVSADKNFLLLVNNIDLDNYVAGVVEAEVGRKPPKEYFKLQAIICRTYALSNTAKHIEQGYNLCDQVHCQAYHGKSFFPEIVNASMQTKGAVIVDSDIQLITAAFHSNCGGETVNSEDVWSKSLYYLRAKKDTFCLDQKNAVWEKHISVVSWSDYLGKYFPNATNDSILYSYSDTNRAVKFLPEHGNLSFEDIRHHYRLRSAFFDIQRKGDSILLKGKGYGHGVGLCQVGAMEMAQQGYTYSEILHFYYSGVHIIDLSALDFFREE